MGSYTDYLNTVFTVDSKKAVAGLTPVTAVLMDIDAQIREIQNQINRQMQQALMAIGLSLLFTGMAIQKFFQNALLALTQTYMEVAGQTDRVNEGVYELQAAWAFFKYDLFDTLKETGIWDGFINGIKSIVDWFTKLPSPVKTAIVIMMVFGLVIGAAMSIAGQTMLFLIGVMVLFNASLAVTLGYMGAFFVVVIAIAAIIGIWSSKMSVLDKVLWTVVIVLAAIAIAILLIWGAVALPIVGIIAVVALLITAFILFKDNLYLVMLQVGQAISDFLIAKINAVIQLINNVISAWNRLTGGHNALIAEVKGADFSGEIARVKAEIESKNSASKNQASSNTKNTTVNIQNMNVSNNDPDAVLKSLNSVISSTTGSTDTVI